MSEDILGQMRLFTTSRQVWAALHDMFGSDTKLNSIILPYKASGFPSHYSIDTKGDPNRIYIMSNDSGNTAHSISGH
jgi:hypothetical protein